MVKKLWVLLVVLLIASLAGDFYMHPHYKFELANMRFFHAIFGFASCLAIVIASKIMGIFLRRKTDYYKEGRDDK